MVIVLFVPSVMVMFVGCRVGVRVCGCGGWLRCGRA